MPFNTVHCFTGLDVSFLWSMVT